MANGAVDWSYKQAKKALTCVERMDMSLPCSVRAVSQSTPVYSSTDIHMIDIRSFVVIIGGRIL